MNKFVNAGIIARNSELDGRSGGVTVEYPFFQEFNLEEEDVDSNEYWGASGQGYLTPQRIQTSKFVIPRVSKGFAFGADQISRIASGEDPLRAMGSYVANNLQTFRTRHLLALLEAAFASGGPLASQKYVATAAAAAVPTAAESISITQVVQALNLMGERSDRITVDRNALQHEALADAPGNAPVLISCWGRYWLGDRVGWRRDRRQQRWLRVLRGIARHRG